PRVADNRWVRVVLTKKGAAVATAVALVAAGGAQLLPDPDHSPPVVRVTSPANGGSANGTTDLTATCKDNVASTSVRFNLNGVGVTDIANAPPFTVSWPSSEVYDGPYQLTATARDAAGNTS